MYECAKRKRWDHNESLPVNTNARWELSGKSPIPLTGKYKKDRCGFAFPRGTALGGIVRGIMRMGTGSCLGYREWGDLRGCQKCSVGLTQWEGRTDRTDRWSRVQMLNMKCVSRFNEWILV